MAILRILGAALMAALLPSGAASAQSYGFAFPGLRSGEPMAAAVAYVGDREGASYPYVIYAVSRSRPEVYFFFPFLFYIHLLFFLFILLLIIVFLVIQFVGQRQWQRERERC